MKVGECLFCDQATSWVFDNVRKRFVEVEIPAVIPGTEDHPSGLYYDDKGNRFSDVVPGSLPKDRKLFVPHFYGSCSGQRTRFPHV